MEYLVAGRERESRAMKAKFSIRYNFHYWMISIFQPTRASWKEISTGNSVWFFSDSSSLVLNTSSWNLLLGCGVSEVVTLLLSLGGASSLTSLVVFVTGPTGPQKLGARGQIPRPAPLNGLGWGLFFFITRPWPRPGARPVQGPKRPPVGWISPSRALYFL